MVVRIFNYLTDETIVVESVTSIRWDKGNITIVYGANNTMIHYHVFDEVFIAVEQGVQ